MVYEAWMVVPESSGTGGGCGLTVSCHEKPKRGVNFKSTVAESL